MTLPFSTKESQLKFINCVVGCHDLCCTCYNPLYHSCKIILNQLAPELTKEDKHQLKQCLGEDTTTKDDDIGVTGEDLEKLFAQDDGEDDATR